MTGPPTEYPASWTPRGTPQAASPAAPIEAIMLAVDSYIAALSPQEFDQLVSRTRG
jgi:hypothetical protein